MNFNTIQFFSFLIIVLIFYWSLSHRLQNWFLLIASYTFYAFWDWRFLSLLFITTATDFFCALKIDQFDFRRDRRKFLLLSIAVNLTILIIFKYFNFFSANFAALLTTMGLKVQPLILNTILPIGISFYTLQSMSYTFDVYRQKIRPIKNFFDYALSISFFPKLVAGPIEKPADFLPQIQRRRNLTPEKLRLASLLIYWGLFKKVFIADNLAIISEYFFKKNVVELNGGILMLSIIAYGIQIYADFSGYTNMAQGIAGFMGFQLGENFITPIFSKNIQDFWQRWHVSLMNWFREYIFMPLALIKIRMKTIAPYWAIFVTFLSVGLWHGAAWNFLIWGAFNGFCLIIFHFWKNMTRKSKAPLLKKSNFLRDIVANLLTLCVILLGLVFFRANSLNEIGDWLTLLFRNHTFGQNELTLMFKIAIYFLPILIVEIFLKQNNHDMNAFFRLPFLVRFGIFYVMLFLMVVFHAPGRDFIYFQF